jgi:hypothetical protein
MTGNDAASSPDATCDAAVASDPKNCGTCGNVCDSNVCANGACAGVLFVTRSGRAGDFGGPAAADAFCTAEAAAAGLKGTYVAWVSTAASPAGARLGQPMTPYVRRDGTPVLANIGDGLSASVRTADGGSPNTSGAWTGTLADGGAASPDGTPNCAAGGASWASDRGVGVAGIYGAPSWSSGVVNQCQQTYGFYCFQKRTP